MLTQCSRGHLVSPAGFLAPLSTASASPEDTKGIRDGASQGSVSFPNKPPASSSSHCGFWLHTAVSFWYTLEKSSQTQPLKHCVLIHSLCVYPAPMVSLLIAKDLDLKRYRLHLPIPFYRLGGVKCMSRPRGSHGKCTGAECQGPLRLASTGVISLCLEVLQNRQQGAENAWRVI